jgi:hypothetical protein
MLLVKALTGRRFETLSWIDKLDYRFGRLTPQNARLIDDPLLPRGLRPRFHLVKPILLICT